MKTIHDFKTIAEFAAYSEGYTDAIESILMALTNETREAVTVFTNAANLVRQESDR